MAEAISVAVVLAVVTSAVVILVDFTQPRMRSGAHDLQVQVSAG
jgi:hypothetical protein